jgi:dihydroorotase
MFQATFATVIQHGTVMDPASGLDAPADIAIDHEGRIAAIVRADEGGLAHASADQRIDATGQLVCPGLIDLHVHIYEWVTNFGVWADDAGVGSGATTVVDQGSTGPWTFGGFQAHVVEKAATDVRAFVSINVAGALMGGMKGDVLHNPDMTDVDAVLALFQKYPESARGIKCHGESGALSHWGTRVLQEASRAGKAAGVPLYVHTGQLFPVIEANRPSPRSVLEQVLPLLKAGDTLAHIYSSMPDGIIGEETRVPDVVHRALDMGVHFDIGYGVNFSYRIARMLMAAGIYPHSISSDLHGDFNSYHDESKLDYSLLGAMSRLWALGMPLMEVIRAATEHPARVIGLQDRIGRIAPGRQADITILQKKREDWTFADGRCETLSVQERLLPVLTLRRGVGHAPRPHMMPDLYRPLALPAAACA